MSVVSGAEAVKKPGASGVRGLPDGGRRGCCRASCRALALLSVDDSVVPGFAEFVDCVGVGMCGSVSLWHTLCEGCNQ